MIQVALIRLLLLLPCNQPPTEVQKKREERHRKRFPSRSARVSTQLLLSYATCDTLTEHFKKVGCYSSEPAKE